MKSTKKEIVLRTEEKVKILLDGIKLKIPFKRDNYFEKFIMFLGSSGVGKTSIIMKLARRYNKNYSVAIISLGIFEKYSNLALISFCKDMNIKHIQVDDLTNLETTKKELNEFDVVMIDTVGRAPYEAELKFDIQLYKNINEVSFFLILPSNLKYRDYLDIYDCYSILDIKNIIVSKLDETRYLKSIIKFLNIEEIPYLSYISTGKAEKFNDCLIEY